DGCAGNASFATAQSLCGPGFRLASAFEWKMLRNGVAPNHDYWTSDALRYSGTGPNNWTVSTYLGYQCAASSPMRVCAAAQPDAEGNTCTWTGCGLDARLPNDFFGGCTGDLTAGAICVSAGECADGTAEQVFDTGQSSGVNLVGCAGAVLYTNR